MASCRIQEEPAWARLDPEAKRPRLLRVARRVFETDGLAAPMPAVAAAAGAGIGSVYRQFPSKGDLIAALVVECLEEMQTEAGEALGSREASWPALSALLWAYGERQATDPFFSEAVGHVYDHPDVVLALSRTQAAMGRALDSALEGGQVRPDATTLDLRLILAAARAADRLVPGAWRRMLELGIGGLARGGPAT